jgi:hypothetical protein
VKPELSISLSGAKIGKTAQRAMEHQLWGAIVIDDLAIGKPAPEFSTSFEMKRAHT